MYCCIHAGGLRGLESYVAQVEVDVSGGLPCFDMVGLLDSEVREARERIRVALKNAGMTVPAQKITVNISPAGIHKAGTAFDLPVALGIMAAQGMIPTERLEGILVVGELGLNGQLKPVCGVLPMVTEAVRASLMECLLPFENLREGLLAGDIPAMGAENLEEALAYLCSDEKGRERLRSQAALKLQKKEQESACRQRTGAAEGSSWQKQSEAESMDFAMVSGMEEAKQAALTAAAGFHNLLLSGPPGGGKTLLARCLPSILPPLSQEQQREVSAIYSVAGLLEQGNLYREHPFVAPHHTVSPYALAGSGLVPRPGLVTLAHRGILFLDELAEFKRSTLDILRQPLEEGRIFLAKGGGSFVYPAAFMLVAATNPCPCGYYPDRNRCRCTSFEIHRYLSRISGPLLDRIDICTTVQPVAFQTLWQEGQRSAAVSSAALRERVIEARQRQQKRYAGTGICVNGRLGAGQIRQYCHLGLKEQQFLERLQETGGFSARACHRMLKVARTLADLEGREHMETTHLSQAFYYRQNEVIRH